MAIAELNFTLDKGTDFSANITVKTDNVPVNLAGYAFSCVMRKHHEAVVGYGLSTTVVAPSSNGVVKLDLHNSVTTDLTSGRYVYDLITIAPSTGIKTKAATGNILVKGSTSNDRT